MIDSIDEKLLLDCMLLALKYYPLKTQYNENQTLNSSDIYTNFEIDVLSKRHSTTIEDADNARDFISNCLRSTSVRPYEIPWVQKLIWAIFFGIMLVVAIIGNCIVIWIVLAHREMRTITNYFLLNLSAADLLMSSLNCVFNFIYMLNSDWPFGSVYCSVNNFMGNVTVAASVFTLVAISFDRYVAIIRPLHRRTSRKKARICIIIIWVLSSLISTPCIIYSAIESKKYINGKTRTVCYLLWPDGKYPTSVAEYVYNLVFLIVTYGVPMIVMMVCYSMMGKELWGSQSIGELTDRQTEAVKSKKKVVKMFIAIVSIFGICWLPYHMFYVYAYHNPEISSSYFVPHLFLGFYWLAMSTTMVNPIIYYWMNRRFRLHFREAACFCCLQFIHANKIQKTQEIYLQQNSMSIDRRKKHCRVGHLQNREMPKDYEQNSPKTL